MALIPFFFLSNVTYRDASIHFENHVPINLTSGGSMETLTYIQMYEHGAKFTKKGMKKKGFRWLISQ